MSLHAHHIIQHTLISLEYTLENQTKGTTHYLLMVFGSHKLFYTSDNLTIELLQFFFLARCFFVHSLLSIVDNLRHQSNKSVYLNNKFQHI